MTHNAQSTQQENPSPLEHAQYGGTSYHSTRAELARQVAQEHARARPQSD